MIGNSEVEGVPPSDERVRRQSICSESGPMVVGLARVPLGLVSKVIIL